MSSPGPSGLTDQVSDQAGVTPGDLDQIRRTLGDRYRLEEEIGRGGMAIVFRAMDLRHQRPVALKIMRLEVARALGVGRFLQEIQIESRLSHPGIVALHDSGDVELPSGVRCPYYVMPFIPGKSLRDRLDQDAQLPVAEALQIATEVAEALAYAHREGVVHRDIKPQNILLADGHALVADFGIARAVSLAGGPTFTSSGMIVGTPGYMSPEQATAGATTDGRSDVYALGCVLYEMLAGGAPFAGPTYQAVIARHFVDHPPSIRTVRPSVGPALEAVVMRCLEKVPADRYPNAGELVQALGAAARHPGRPRSRARIRATRAGIGAVIGLGLAGGIWAWLRPRPRVDPRRVVVFPLRVVDSAAIPADAGEAVATYIGHGLEQTDPLKWLDGWALLASGSRGASGIVSGREATAITRRQGARYYITGQILAQTDSLTVVVSLFDALGDTLVRRAGLSALARSASLPQLGLRAVGSLLPPLLAPGRRVDLGALVERRPSAIAHFLQGEAEYRRMRFADALPHYRMALVDDSALAIAALRAAEAANWEAQFGEDDRFVGSALSRLALLPARDRPYARGLQHYFAGRAEPALRELTAAAHSDSSWTEAWTALGEVYFHLFPRGPPLDSLALDAFTVAVRSDSGFAPAVFHLAQLALRSGQVDQARRLAGRIRGRNPESARDLQLGLLIRCVSEGPGAIEWAALARQSARPVLNVAHWAASIAYATGCGESGFRAVLASPASLQEKWGALLALQGLLLATGRGAELAPLFEQARTLGLPGRPLYLLAATVDSGLTGPAQAFADEQATSYAGAGTPNLWLLGEFEAARGNRQRVAAILTALRAERDASRSRRDSLIVRILEAHQPLLEGDTLRALGRLRLLLPTGRREDLEWQPWESLGPEFLLLADLLVRRGEFREAWDVAARLDAPDPVVYLMFLPRSLELRRQAARALGATGRSEELDRRLGLLRGRT